jgi:hypothetical protein
MKPKFLGAIFNILSETMKMYPGIELDSKPRMADFAMWGSAVAIALGLSQDEFMQSYQKNINLQNTEALEANPISRVLISFMEKRMAWSGTATELHHQLKDHAADLNIDTKDKQFPKDPRWLWRRLKEVEPNLSAIGIHMEKDDSNHETGRQIKIYNSKVENEVSETESNFDVHNDRNVQGNGHQDNTDDILDKLLEDENLFTEPEKLPYKGHSDACDCEMCIPEEE